MGNWSPISRFPTRLSENDYHSSCGPASRVSSAIEIKRLESPGAEFAAWPLASRIGTEHASGKGNRTWSGFSASLAAAIRLFQYQGGRQ
jgi:hypothetical protein